MLISRSAVAGIHSFTLSPDYMVSVVEGLKPGGVSDMMTGGGSGTITEHGERWDRSMGLDPPRPKSGSRHSVCKHRDHIGSGM